MSGLDLMTMAVI